ncbi:MULTISPECIES: PQQ-dependent dehydrogenase, methanol/ethanol family [unclassified Sphingobium]|uniref:PQQ-dependent dehydrogenase, methanol/ethanol family n=1 Tax=unclassified Sphingobium TaxID=2611147 RepID=UPI002225802F|nr:MULTISPECIES: PQQ-dependent dehydrogenase, methanol/ethanol family [unclassified Sphingobium]MCW2383073.1 quinohemoprotein ethanol dehydrogenase [Sphingobium sp. B2D3B]MCW2399951.1 quinohemoprotein ethanol dehydrogenase [Sphingobium sp. B2D3C]
MSGRPAVPPSGVSSLLGAMLGLALLAACSNAPPGSMAGPPPFGAGDDWDNPGGDWAESRYSRLTDIDKTNVGRLGLAWDYDLGTTRVQEATPVVIDGVMYTSGNLGRAYALDAATGRQLWAFSPEVDMQVNRYACCDQANRGVAVADGKVFVAALDGWLYALDQKTGAVVWKADSFLDRNRAYTSTGAPEVAGDLVIIGNAGAEYDTRGYVIAFDIRTGKEAWRFYTIPRDPALGPQESKALEAALKTWNPKSRWDIGGGGTAWDAITYDPEFDQVIIGVGNGGPYAQAIRSPGGGDNLYLSSLVALDRKTGAMKWHFQETPGDNWDFTSVQPMILTRMAVNGAERPVLLHTPKNGFFFMLDRETGKPLAVHRMVRTSWASGWDLKTGKPIATPEYSDINAGPKLVFPAPPGARNWYGAAYDPQRKMYVAHFLDMGNLIMVPPANLTMPRRKLALNAGTESIFTPFLEAALPGLPKDVQKTITDLPQWQWVKDKPWAADVRAVDPVTGRTIWSYPREDGWQDRSGVLTTQSGLTIFGTLSGKLVILDSDTGKVVRTIDTGRSILAAPMTYRVKGVQYIAVQTGWGGGGWGLVPDYSAAYAKGNANRILVFRLDGGPVPIPPDLPPEGPIPAPPLQISGTDADRLAKGRVLFSKNCSICHSNMPRAPLPSLTRMSEGAHQAFEQIVLEGLLLPNGMPRWDDLLTRADVQAIHAHLIDLQSKAYARQQAGAPPETPIYSRITTAN